MDSRITKRGQSGACFTLFIFLVFLFANIANASTSPRLNAPLRALLNETAADEIVPVLVLMAERPDISELREAVDGLPRDERSAVVWAELVRLAETTQHDLLEYLRAERERGRVESFESLRISNGVILRALPDVILETASRNDVWWVLDDRERTFPEDEWEETDDELDEIIWNLRRINAPDIWADGYTGQGVLVSVIDTGVNYEHLDLQDHLWDGGQDYPLHGYDFYNDDNDPQDTAGHGTAVAGVVCGDGTAGDTTGVAFDATLMILKVRENLNLGIVTDTWLAQDFALEHGVDVTQMSLGWGTPQEGDRTVWRGQYDVLNVAGIINVKSAGNRRGDREPPDAISVPGGVPSPWRSPDEVEEGTRSGLITVGATDLEDVIGTFSSPGPVTWMNIEPYFDWVLDLPDRVGLIKPDIAAPGVNGMSISASNNEGYVPFSHTSMAAPHVAGVVAMMLSKDPDLLPVEVDSILETSALELGDPGKDNDYGAGRVQADVAVDAIHVPMGTLEGNVLDANTGAPLEGARVFMNERPRRHDDTDENGDYSFAVQTGQYMVMARYLAGPAFEAGEVTIEENETAQLDLVYPYGIFSVQPDDFTIELLRDTVITREISFSNTGTAPYEVTMSLAPDIEDTLGYLDVLSSFDAGGPAGTLQLNGLAYSNRIFFVSATTPYGEANRIIKLGRNGNYYGSFDQPGPTQHSTGMQDLAFDGSLLWGGDSGTIYGISPETGVVEREFAGPYEDMSGIACDNDRNVLWIASEYSDILAVDPISGEVCDTLTNSYTVAGLAYLSTETFGGKLLVAVHSGSNTRRLYTLDTETGDFDYQQNLPSEAGGDLIGLTAIRGFQRYYDVIAGLLISDDFAYLSTWQIATAFRGVSLERDSIQVPADEDRNVDVFFSLDGLEDDDYHGFINLSYTAGEGYFSIPVHLTINLPVAENETESAVPAKFRLDATYPNPFNSQTIVSFSVPMAAGVSVRIYDILGRQCATLVDERVSKGRHSVVFNARGLSSGMYFVTLRSGNNVLVRKIVLMK